MCVRVLCAGDGGMATLALLYWPSYARVRPDTGDIVLLDSNNNRVRVIYKNGTIDTLAGDGKQGA